MREKPGLHQDERRDDGAEEVHESLRDARDELHFAARSDASTGAVSGRTPRQMQNDSAACSTSIPSPSTSRVAPASRASVKKGSGALAVGHVVRERPAGEHARLERRQLAGEAGRGRIDHDVERLARQHRERHRLHPPAELAL